jgi:hypothetical protein
MGFLQLRQTVAPAVLPVSIQQARRHSRIDFKDDDDLLSVYLQTATTMAESYLDRALITRQLSLTVARSGQPQQWPMAFVPIILPLGLEYAFNISNHRQIELLRSPVQSVESVAQGFWGADDVALTVGTDYDLDLTTDPARIRLYGSTFQPLNSDHMVISYTAGYGDTPASIPTPIIHAIMLMTNAGYEHRGDGEGEIMSATARSLLDPFRLVSFA